MKPRQLEVKGQLQLGGLYGLLCRLDLEKETVAFASGPSGPSAAGTELQRRLKDAPEGGRFLLALARGVITAGQRYKRSLEPSELSSCPS